MNDASEPARITVRREIAAPAQELFDAWLDPASLAIWMRPGDTRRTTARVDARVGGRFEIDMQLDSGPNLHTGIYQEIDRPRRLVFTWNSRATRQTDSLVTVEFRPVGRKTEIVLTHERLPGKEAADGHNRGWTAILELISRHYGELRASA